MSRKSIVTLAASLALFGAAALHAGGESGLPSAPPAAGAPPVQPIANPAAPSAPAVQPLVTLEELLEEALRSNPAIRAAQKRFEGSRLRPSIVSSLPDPMLSFASSNIGNPLPATTLGEQDMSQAGLSLQQEMPFPGKLRLQGQIAEKEATADWDAYRDAQLQVASQLKQAFYRWHFVHRALDVVRRNTDLLQQFSRIAAARYAVGQGIQQDVLRAQTELSLLERRRLALERDRHSLAARINTLLNRPPDSPLGEPAEYPRSALTASLSDLYQTAAASPQLGQKQAKIEQNTLALSLSRKEYYPDFAVEAGWASRGRLPDMWETRVAVRLPLYFWRKQRYAVREAAQAVEEARHDYDATRQALLFRIQDEYLTARTSEQLLALYEKTLLPQAALTLESAMASYQAGTLDFLSLLTNFQNVLEYELEYHDQFATFHEALARLEETTGRPAGP